jgi:hypothetical protein
LGCGTQQSVMQFSPVAQRGPSSPHEPMPVGQAGAPPEAQLGSGAVRPTQTSHGSQSFLHDGTGVQGRQIDSSSRVSSVQPTDASWGEPSQTYLSLPAGRLQQPKQSQPFGMSGPQISVQQVFPHIESWLSRSSAQVAVIPGMGASSS